jgi:polyhydroxyalkanoate synthesis regulator phasin
MLAAFADLGGATHLLSWAKKNPSDFYRLFARLTPPGFPVRLEGFGSTPAEQGRVVMAKLSAGEITPEQAGTIMQAVSAQARIIEIDELERRLKALEEKSDGLARK